MKAIRGLMTVFLLVIVGLSILGWRWSAALDWPQIGGARAALVITAIAACVGLGVIWREKPRSSS